MGRFFSKKKKKEKDSDLLKILLLGDRGVGKTSLMFYALNNCAPSAHQLTHIPSGGFHMKLLNGYRLQVWDIDSNLTKLPKAARDYDCAIVVNALDGKSDAEAWDNFVERTAEKGAIRIHVGSKKDLYVHKQDLGVAHNSDIHEMRSVPMVKYLEVSAKTGQGVQDLFQVALDEVLKARATASQEAAPSKRLGR